MNKEFRKYLREVCTNHGINLVQLAVRSELSPSYFSRIGINKKISYNKLNEVLKVIPATSEESQHLKSVCEFSKSVDGIIIDDDFLNAVTYFLESKDRSWGQPKAICQAVLHFAGVATTVK